MKFIHAVRPGLPGLFCLLTLISGPAQSQTTANPPLLSLPPLAAPTLSYELQRANIEAQRSVVQTQFDEAAVVCYQRFAVNDCLQAARTVRRDRLADLRKQSLAVRDAQAQQKATERLQGR